MVDMALNGSGIRHTARVLGVSPMTVMSTLKKSAYAPPSEPRLGAWWWGRSPCSGGSQGGGG